ncbi:MAG: DUF4020 domain-containing protein [Lachnospiraceae bacterium]|nr:DUF4020 domain-containing protein [Lachnospiraceae bacterium]
MIAKDIDFPRKIIEAIEANKLVVFAGAGVSMGAPTKLPDFKKLTKTIANSAGYIFNRKEKDFERVLGRIKEDYHVDVNSEAAEILNSSCLVPNDTHRAIVNLFKEQKAVRIVTTNYDLMFEKVFEEKGYNDVKKYSAPSLPLGNDFTGIVHIHGSVDEPKYMVVTDEDFGAAYMLYGHSSRFLFRLFEEYTVLFVGYSYSDTIVKYLTRSIIQKNRGNLFALTDANTTEWKLIGITTLPYPQNAHVRMRDALVDLGSCVNRSLTEWQSRIKYFYSKPPEDPYGESEIEFCLEKEPRARVLSKNVCGKEWFDFFLKKGVFQSWFSNADSMSHYDEIWFDWILNEYKSNEYEPLLKLFGMYKGEKINAYFARKLLWQATSSSFSDEALLHLLLLLQDHIVDLDQSLVVRIKTLCERQLYDTAFDLFLLLFDPVFYVEESKSHSGSEDIRFQWRTRWTYDNADLSWRTISKSIQSLNVRRALLNTVDCIRKIYYRCYVNGLDVAGARQEAFETSFIDIERRDNRYFGNAMPILSEVVCCLARSISKSDKQFITTLLLECINGPSMFLRRIALKSLREVSIVGIEKKFAVVVHGLGWDRIQGRKQIWMLAETIAKDLSTNQQHRLIKAIKEEYHYIDGEKEPEEARSWFRRLQAAGMKSKEIDMICAADEGGNDVPMLIDEGVVVGKFEFKSDSPLSRSKMASMTAKELLEYIDNYVPKEYSEYSLLNEFSTHVSEASKDRIMDLLREATTVKKRANDVCLHLFTGIERLRCSEEDYWAIVDCVSEYVGQLSLLEKVSNVLLTAVHSKISRENLQMYEPIFWKCVYSILASYSGRLEYKTDSLWIEVANNTLGLLSLSAIWMVAYQKEDTSIERYLLLFEKMMSDYDEGKELIVCVLAGQFDMFYARDPKWCKKVIIPFLEGNNREEFRAAWIGVENGSSRWGLNNVSATKKIYLKALPKIKEWGSEDISGIIAFSLADLLIIGEGVLRRNSTTLITLLYKSSHETSHVTFVNRIDYLLNNMDEKQRTPALQKSLKSILNNRVNGVPTELSPREMKHLLGWILNLPLVYDETVNIVTRYTQKVDASFFVSNWAKSSLIVESPKSSAKLLRWVLNGNLEVGYLESVIEEICKKILPKLEQSDKDALGEALLGAGYSFDFGM